MFPGFRPGITLASPQPSPPWPATRQRWGWRPWLFGRGSKPWRRCCASKRRALRCWWWDWMGNIPEFKHSQVGVLWVFLMFVFGLKWIEWGWKFRNLWFSWFRMFTTVGFGWWDGWKMQRVQRVLGLGLKWNIVEPMGNGTFYWPGMFSLAESCWF